MELKFGTEDLAYSYGGAPILDGITFDVIEGEVLGILGVNGSGKTTLLKNLNKNLSPQGGCVLLDGQDLAEIAKRDIAKSIAAVPQTNEISFSFTVREIVSMGRMPFQGMLSPSTAEDEAIIDDAIRKTGLDDLQNRHINTMSGGERQRAIIARAVAQTPRIILMDEPTLHLDISMQFDALDLVHGLAKEKGLTVVIVSHDLPMVARYCDRIIMIHEHNIFCEGTPEEVLTEENMRTVFGIDAELVRDPKTGMNTVLLHGSARRRAPRGQDGSGGGYGNRTRLSGFRDPADPRSSPFRNRRNRSSRQGDCRSDKSLYRGGARRPPSTFISDERMGTSETRRSSVLQH